jgi:hypothetical protein
LEEAVELILEFNRNCKRRKGKRKEEDDDGSESEEVIVEEARPLMKTR